MIADVSTNGKKCLIKLKLAVKEPMNLGIYAMDKARPKSFYYKQVARIDEATGSWFLNMEFAQTPRKLSFFLYDADKGMFAPSNSFQLIDIDKEPLKTQEHLLSAADKRFQKFAMGFAAKAKYIPVDRRVSDGKHVIYVFDMIRNQDGTIEETPARVDLDNGPIDVSMSMVKLCSVPSLVYVLDHEYSHTDKNLDENDEFEADKNGARIYLYSGNPASQAMYSFTKIFSDNEFNAERTARLAAYIEEFKQTGRIA